MTPAQLTHQFRSYVANVDKVVSMNPEESEHVYSQLLSGLLDLTNQGFDVNQPAASDGMAPLHWCLDWCADEPTINWLLEHGADPNVQCGEIHETALHVAARRRRASFIEFLLNSGADIDAKTVGGKTAWVHAARRGFDDITSVLEKHDADQAVTAADELAIHLVNDRFEHAATLIEQDAELVPSMTPEEARILPDVAGRSNVLPTRMLLDSGADITARGLDGGTALHQACWFGQPQQAEVILQHDPPLKDSGDAHDYTPLGWVCHGSRYSGGVGESEVDAKYATLAELLLNAGASLAHPRRDNHGGWLLADASDQVAAVLRKFGAKE